MKIVVLDGYTANPGDLSWEPLKECGELACHDRTPVEQVLERLQGADIVLTNKVPFDRERINELPDLKYIGVTATGYNIVDIDAARERDIVVTNVPAYSTASVAQMTFALLLELTQQVGHHNCQVKAGRWSESPDFCFWDKPLVELDGLTLGVVGFGQIGQRVARIARCFGMEVLVTTSNPNKYRGNLMNAQTRFVDLEELLTESDVVSLHLPLTADNAGMIDSRRLALMKPTAFLINTSRGPLIDEAALVQALEEEKLAGAALDVLNREPPPKDTLLQDSDRAIITPHIAWATQAARRRLLDTCIANVQAFVAGKPQNVVS